MIFREATYDDAFRIAKLQAHNWQQHYRGLFSDHYLDKEVHAERLHVWQVRLQHPANNQYVLIAEENQHLAGFICGYFNDDDEFGSYLDNLHVDATIQGKGVGTQLMAQFAKEIENGKARSCFYLWVVDTNLASIAYYTNVGGVAFEKLETDDIGDKTFFKVRFVWKDTRQFLDLIDAKNRT